MGKIADRIAAKARYAKDEQEQVVSAGASRILHTVMVGGAMLKEAGVKLENGAFRTELGQQAYQTLAVAMMERGERMEDLYEAAEVLDTIMLRQFGCKLQQFVGNWQLMTDDGVLLGKELAKAPEKWALGNALLAGIIGHLTFLGYNEGVKVTFMEAKLA